MKLQAQYDKLYAESLPEIQNGNYHIDQAIDASIDNRFGLSLIIQPTKEVILEVSPFLNQLKKANQHQYYYESSQIHVTVLSIISCYAGFVLESISVPKYVEIIKQSLSDIKDFEIHYHGLTLSRGGVMVQGYPKQDDLERLRDNLRENIMASGLQQSMDQRYRLTTAHTTVMRFRNRIMNLDSFVGSLQENRERDFGSQRVTTLKLVYTDWYHRKDKVKYLHEFQI